MIKMNKDIKTIYINGERIFIKKSPLFGWGVVHPPKVDGKWNIKNLIAGGSWLKLGFLALIIFFIYGAIKEYVGALELAKRYIETNITIIP